MALKQVGAKVILEGYEDVMRRFTELNGAVSMLANTFNKPFSTKVFEEQAKTLREFIKEQAIAYADRKRELADSVRWAKSPDEKQRLRDYSAQQLAALKANQNAELQALKDSQRVARERLAYGLASAKEEAALKQQMAQKEVADRARAEKEKIRAQQESAKEAARIAKEQTKAQEEAAKEAARIEREKAAERERQTMGIAHMEFAIAGKLNPAIASAGSAVAGLVTAMGGPAGLVAAIGAASIAGGLLSKVVDGLVSAFNRFKQAVVTVGETLWGFMKTAAPLSDISTAFARNVVGFGISLDQLRAAAAGVISDFDLMKSANTALASTSTELGKAFGENLPTLLNIARVMARATGQDMGYMFDSIVRGIKRTEPRLIDNALLIVKVKNANQAWAEENDAVIASMSAEERQLSLMQATIDAGSAAIKQYGLENYTALDYMQGTEAMLKNISNYFGLFFQPALKTASKAIYDFLSAISRSIQEGGAFYDLLVRLGAVASIFADWFAAGTQRVIDFVDDLYVDLEGGFSEIAYSMAEWGVNIIASFAEGMAWAIEAFVTPAIGMLAGLLSWFFSPGSPPRVAPEIDQWGMATIEEWLRGMTDADFGILDKLQSPLKRVLDDATFRSVSIDIIEALSTGDIDESLFDRIAQEAGAFGSSIADLARLEIQLADATERLARANKEYEDSQKKVASLTADYNDMLRAGASDEQLAMKLSEIRAEEQRRDIARAAARQAEKDVAAVEERTKVQERLVDQLIELGLLGDDAAERAKKLAGGKGATPERKEPGMPDWENLIGGAGEFDIAGKIASAIDAAKAELEPKMRGLFQPLLDAIFEVQLAFATMKTNIEFSVVGLVSSLGPGGLQDTFSELRRTGQLLMILFFNPFIIMWNNTWGPVFSKVATVFRRIATNLGLIGEEATNARSPLQIFNDILAWLLNVRDTALDWLWGAFHNIGLELQGIVDRLLGLGSLVGMSMFAGEPVLPQTEEEKPAVGGGHGKVLPSILPEKQEFDLSSIISGALSAAQTVVTQVGATLFEPVETSVTDAALAVEELGSTFTTKMTEIGKSTVLPTTTLRFTQLTAAAIRATVNGIVPFSITMLQMTIPATKTLTERMGGLNTQFGIFNQLLPTTWLWLDRYNVLIEWLLTVPEDSFKWMVDTFAWVSYYLERAVGDMRTLFDLYTNLDLPGQPVKQLASGTSYAPGGLSLVGERGPELVNLPRGSQVYDTAQTMQMLDRMRHSVSAPASTSVTNYMTIGPNYVNNGMDEAVFISRVEAAVARTLQ